LKEKPGDKKEKKRKKEGKKGRKEGGFSPIHLMVIAERKK